MLAPTAMLYLVGSASAIDLCFWNQPSCQFLGPELGARGICCTNSNPDRCCGMTAAQSREYDQCRSWNFIPSEWTVEAREYESLGCGGRRSTQRSNGNTVLISTGVLGGRFGMGYGFYNSKKRDGEGLVEAEGGECDTPDVMVRVREGYNASEPLTVEDLEVIEELV